MKVAILLPNWIGDVVMATPTLRALRQHYDGKAELIGIMKPYVSKVLDGTPWLDHSEWYDRKSQDRSLRTRGLIKRLREHAPSTMVLLTNSFRGAAIAKLSGIPQRVGYARYGRRLLLSQAVQPPREDGKLKPVSAIDYYLQLAYELGCPPQSPQMELATKSSDDQIVSEIWQRFGFNHLNRIIVFNTGGAYGAAKHWPTENYVGLAKQIVDSSSDDGVLVICGPAEVETAAWVESEVNHPRVRSMAQEDLSLGVAKSCVRRSQMMVTTDSGPRHFAPAFNVPVVSLFGPIDPRWSDSHYSHAVNLIHPVDCGPCGKRTCPLGHHACMRNLTVARVYTEMMRLSDRVPQRHAA